VDSNDQKLKVLIPFLRVKSDPMTTGPPPTLFTPNSCSQFFYIAILFKIDQRSHNKNSGNITAPKNPGTNVGNYAPGAYTIFKEGRVI